MRTYQEVIKELKAKGIKPYKANFYESYDFDTPLAIECDKLFNFGQEFLDRDDLELIITPARLYFSDDNNLNALARKQSDYYLIEIFRGTISWIKNFYESKRGHLSNTRFDFFKGIAASKNTDPCDLLVQSLAQYCFYHEAGHLIQRKLQDEDYVEFSDSNYNPREVSVRHMRELDADWHAASCMAIHAGEFTNDPDEQKEVIVMCLAGIYLFWIEIAKGKPLYYEENDHPHPVIRLSYMIVFLLHAFKTIFNSSANYDTMLEEAISVSEILVGEEEKSIVKEYDRLIRTNIGEIQAYIAKIITNTESYPYLSRNVVGIEPEK